MLSDVWSENAALFERLMEIHSNPPILYYGFNVQGDNTQAGPPCTCMGELTVQARNAGRGLLANHSAIFCPLAFLIILFLSEVIVVGDPRALLESMFLDISAVSGVCTKFSQTNFVFCCKIIYFIESDNQFSFISHSNEIAQAPSNPLLILPFKL